MDVNWDAAKFWLDVAQWVLTIVLGIALWIKSGSKENKTVIAKQAESFKALQDRVVAVEEHIRHAPTHEDISKLRAQYSALDSKLDRVTNTVDRIHDYLMNKKD